MHLVSKRDLYPDFLLYIPACKNCRATSAESTPPVANMGYPIIVVYRNKIISMY